MFLNVFHKTLYDWLEYFNDDKVADVAGQRQIFHLSNHPEEGPSLTVVEEGKNCGIFIC